ncbi:MAG: DHH family phosphoesterase [Eubacteriaceae bacterium]|nr:DHH family phosphoesterase [Eubacteriaceae bacterium]
MRKNSQNTIRIVILILISALLAAAAGFYAGRSSAEKKAEEDMEALFELNRQSIEKMAGKDATVYVIGHMSPDSDTVISAIAYARLLRMLGYDARAAVTSNVNKETAYILEQAGEETPMLLEDAGGEYIFLVDHSEYLQAVPGMEEAYIIGILDHHGVGSVTTGHQVLYDARPLGATATIVWLTYMNYGLDIDSQTAYMLICAILSDTVNLSSTTTTQADREAVRWLAEKAGIEDIGELFGILNENLLSYDGMSDEEIFFSDYKKYEASGVDFGIGIVQASDEESAKELSERMKTALPGIYGKTGMQLLYADVTIRYEDVKIDYVVPADEYSADVLTSAFPEYEFDGTAYIFRKGLGRKTVFVPGLTEYLSAHPLE